MEVEVNANNNNNNNNNKNRRRSYHHHSQRQRYEDEYVTTKRICIPPYTDRFFNLDNVQMKLFMNHLHKYQNICEVIIELSRLEDDDDVELDPILQFIQSNPMLTKIVLSGGGRDESTIQQQQQQQRKQQQHHHQQQQLNRILFFDNSEIIDSEEENRIGIVGRFLQAIAWNEKASITELRLYNIVLHASELQYFLQTSHSPSICRRVWFHYCTFQYDTIDDELIPMARALVHNDSMIRKLSFSEINSFDLSIILNVIAEGLDMTSCNSISSVSHLEELDLQHVDMNIISPCICSILTNNKINNQREESSSLSSSSFRTCTRLKHLSLSGCTLDYDCFQLLLTGIQQNSTLERFVMANVHMKYATSNCNNNHINHNDDDEGDNIEEEVDGNNDDALLLIMQQNQKKNEQKQRIDSMIRILGNNLTLQQINLHLVIDDDNTNYNNKPYIFTKRQQNQLQWFCTRNQQLQKIIMNKNHNNTIQKTRKQQKNHYDNNYFLKTTTNNNDCTSNGNIQDGNSSESNNNNSIIIPSYLWPAIFELISQSSSSSSTASSSSVTVVGASLIFHALLLIMDEGRS